MFLRGPTIFMATSLALFGVLRALTIDNQLTIIKNDCYERLAIGQRLSPKDVYKSVQANTVPDCQLACTKEQELCKSFSFGIGVKGNATCELNVDGIKETADLKPIGTVANPDFDLYIKKLGCTIVIDNTPVNGGRPPENPHNSKPQLDPPQDNRPTNNQNYDDRPESPQNFDHHRPDEKPQRPNNAQNYDRPHDSRPHQNYDRPNNQYYDKPQDSRPSSPSYNKPGNQYYDNEEHVQTLVSVSTGPNRPVLHPVHEILIGEGPYTYGQPRPPFRPSSLNHPYDEHPHNQRPNYYGSDGQYFESRPDYDSRPVGNQQFFNYVDRFGYGYRPDDRYRPKPGHDYLFQNDEPYGGRPNRYEKPRPINDPNNPNGGYGRPPASDDGYNPSGGKPLRPEDNYERPRPINDQNNLNGGYGRPPVPDEGYNPSGGKPLRPEDNYERPRPINDQNRPNGGYDRPIGGKPLRPERPRPIKGPNGGYDNEDNYQRPIDGHNDRPLSGGPSRPGDDYERPSRPQSDYEKPRPVDRPSRPQEDYQRPRPSGPSNGGYDRPLGPPGNGYEKPRPLRIPDNPNGEYNKNQDKNSDYQSGNSIKGGSVPKDPHSKPIVTQSIGPYGESITSIITELKDACFRRVLAGKRVARGFVKRSLVCERIEDCQRECADEKYFVCEGFNYRLDPSGRAKGECELLDVPIARLDIGRDLYPDPDYDYYERDRNAAVANCNRRRVGYPVGSGYGEGGGYGGGYHSDRRYDYEDGYGKRPDYDSWSDDRNRFGSGSRNPRPDFDRRPDDYDWYDNEYRPNGNRRGDFAYHHSHHSQQNYEHAHNYHFEYSDNQGHDNYHGVHYLPPSPNHRPHYQQPPYDYKSYEPYLPLDRRPYVDRQSTLNYYSERERDKNFWGFEKPNWGSYGGSYGNHDRPHDYDQRNYYLPPKVGGTKDWGQYGGSYGNGGYGVYHTQYGQNFDYWGFKKYDERHHHSQSKNNYLPEPPRRPPSYLPERPPSDNSYLPEPPRGPPSDSYGPPRRPSSGGGYPEQARPPPSGDSYEPPRRPPSGDSYEPPRRPPSGSSYPEPPPRPPSVGSYLPEPPKRPPSDSSYLPEPPRRPPSGGSYPPPRPSGEESYLPEPPSRAPSYLPEPPRRPPIGGSYLPEPPRRPTSGGSYLPEGPRRPPNYLPEPPRGSGYYPLPPSGGHYGGTEFPNSILPAEPRFPNYNFLKDECSLRSATGFRLHKGIVKKFYAVPSIYECELLCFKEKDFPCASYAFRYTVSTTAPTDNCYLSNRNYKELDFYTDLQPDRDFDIYTMNNQNRCEQPMVQGKDTSDCFWRVRSGRRLDQSVVRDSLKVDSIVQCQTECLRSRQFTCRAYSFRYGDSYVAGGVIDNCQLTDWPYYELNPRIHFIPAPGFEIYDRGSYGHGCEPDHFGIRGKPWTTNNNQADQLCYIGFGSPARLLPQATRKALRVQTELDCKTECSKLREGTLFQCMSFSYRNSGPRGVPNCELSDILQRDLLPNIDYVSDPDSWLFAWDNFNPQCVAIAKEPVHNHIAKEEGIEDRYGHASIGPGVALDTWRVYSVSGWPCRRGSRCRQNREAGFWFCELEGGDENSWDYCCRPDHQCGFSEDFQYQWCYVGPEKTQWRKCSDRYYPYLDNYIDRFDSPPSSEGNSIRDPWFGPPHRPDRPPAPPKLEPPRPSLDEYEHQFESQFLEPPRPGGFGQPRHWPVSYLHKDKPPNNTDSEPRSMKGARGQDSNPKFAAIQNLIDVIKSNDLKNVQYQITNESNKEDDILFVKIPLPTNFTQETNKSEKLVKPLNASTISEPIDLADVAKSGERSQKSLPVTRMVPVYRKSYITRTNVTNYVRPRTK